MSEHFKHYKGSIYTLVGEALHTETKEKLVIYMNASNKIFARPHAMFYGFVVVDGRSVHRFEEAELPSRYIVRMGEDGKLEVYSIEEKRKQ